MSDDSVTQWLEQLGLGQYGTVFAENDIDWALLPELDQEILKDIGITSAGHRLLIIKAASSLQEDSSDTNLSGEFVSRSPDAPASHGEAERRQLTVMFCDLVGSTGLSQKLDPEDLREVNRTYQDACKAAVEQYEGYIARYMGDGVLCYFGWPQAHEDDAERAIHAGLGVVDGVSTLNASVGKKHGIELSVRVGIATGPVVAGDLIGEGTAQESAAVGETPNLAARLQSLAAPNVVVIAPGTYELVASRFEYEDLGGHELKGITELVHVRRVIAPTTAESRFETAHRTGLTPLVGREHEIGLLLDRWQQAKEGDGQVILLSGEAGIGKSRVTQALHQYIAPENAIRLHYQCSPYHTSSVLHPVIAQLAWAAHIQRNEQASTKLDKLESLLGPLITDIDKVMPLFAALLSIPTEGRYAPITMTPEQLKGKTLEALIKQMKSLSKQCPVLILFEDTHWSDPTSLELLGLIVEEAQSHRVLVLITFRPDFIPTWTGYTHITALTLNRFSRSRVIAMMEKVAAGKSLPNEVRDQIIERTDGVPLFVEELTKTVLESGLVEDRGDHYTLTRPLPPFAIPSTLQDSLMARLDRLESAKETAQIAALLGREFSYELLSKVSPLSANALVEALTQLSGAGLVFAKGTPPSASYTFKHAMVQDVAYESLLKSKRRQLHASVAAALDEENAEPEILAHHYSEAGLYESALTYWLKAGQRALERSANLETVTHLRKGLGLLRTLPESSENSLCELALQLVLGPALMALKGYAAQEVEPVYTRARELCQRVGGPSQLFAATWGLWLHNQQAGQLKQARDLAEDVLAIAEKQEDTALLLQAHHAAWATLHRLGELAVCKHHAEQGIGLYDIKEHGTHSYLYGGHDPGVCAQTHVGIVLWCQGCPDRALERALDALELSEQLSHPFSRADALFGSARVHLFRREYDLAQACAKEMITLSTEHGFSLLEAWGTIIQGSATVNEGQTQGIIEKMCLGVAVTRDTGAQAHVPYLLSLLVDAYLQTSQVDEGLATVADAIELIERTGERYWEAEVFRLKGELLLMHSTRDQVEAERCFNQTLKIATTQGAKLLELRGAMSLARLWRKHEKHEEVRNLLAPIYNWFTEGFDTADLKEAKALLEQLS
nr:AAA family ATPase [Gammaproteobacteria bacterium]